MSNQLTLTDVATLRTAHVDATAYYRAPYRAMLSAKQLMDFTVLDIEPVGPPQPGRGGYQLADATVARTSDLGRNDTVLTCRTHLGALLRPGDTALGYDVASANLCEPELERYGPALAERLPDVILVRKSYAARRRARREKGTASQRAWTLRRLALEAAGGGGGGGGGAGGEEEAAPSGGGRNAHLAARRAAEEEAFLEELEEDAELRARVALYKARHPGAPAAAAAAPQRRRGGGGGGETDDDDDVPEVPLEELLDELQLRGGGDDDDDMEDEDR